MKEDIFISSESIRSLLANTKQLTFEVTDACNLNCKYCGYGELYSDYDDRKNNMLGTERAIQLLDYMNTLWNSAYNKVLNQPLSISFYGGEPLLNMKFITEVVNYLNSQPNKWRKFRYSMTTNAILLDKYMDFLVENNFKILISLDGNKENNSHRIDHHGNNSFDKIVRNLDLLKQSYPDYFNSCISFNSVLHNKNSVEDVYAFFKDKYNVKPYIAELGTAGVRENMQEKFNTMFKSSVESLRYSKEYKKIENDLFIRLPTVNSLNKFLLATLPSSFGDFNELLNGKKTIPKKFIPTATCLPFSKKVFVTVNGKILPCERIGQQFALGYIGDKKIEIDFDAIAAKYNHYYSKLFNRCAKCHQKSFCSKCMFNLSDIEKENTSCNAFMNKEDFINYKKFQYDFLRQNPEYYSRLIKEVTSK